MTALQVLDALTELGITLSVKDGKLMLTKPPGFAAEGRLALLAQGRKQHHGAILEMFQAVEPWPCRECRRMFYASQKDVKEQYAGRSPDWCPSRSCPQMPRVK